MRKSVIGAWISSLCRVAVAAILSRLAGESTAQMEQLPKAPANTGSSLKWFLEDREAVCCVIYGPLICALLLNWKGNAE